MGTDNSTGESDGATQATPLSVAEWMLTQAGRGGWIHQETIVYRIRNTFGPTFVYQNRNGNLAINKEVLKAFRALTEETHVWERGSRAWRLRREHDRAGRSQH